MNKHLNESIYHAVQTRPLEVSERDLAKIFDQVRFDARLMEVATEFIRDYWWNINPSEFNRRLKLSKNPFAVKPAIYAVLKCCSFPSEDTKLKFMKWYEVVAQGIKDPSPQLFYFNIYPIGSKSLNAEVDEAIECFSKFNLFAKDLPFNKAIPKTVRTKEMLLGIRLNLLDLEKNECAVNIKNLKWIKHLTNEQMSQDLEINRDFLSRILNNNLNGITLDYLIKKEKVALEKYG